ncbi:MAG: hypothetical protein K6343_03380 [Caldisericaceae bacterium]
MGEFEKNERFEKLTGSHVLWASTMSALFDFGVAGPLVPTMKMVGQKIALFQIQKNTFPSTRGKELGKELFIEVFDKLNSFVNFAYEYEVDFLTKENGNGKLIVKINRDSCMYSIVGVGGEQLFHTTCPYPSFFSSYLDFALKSGFFYKSVKMVKEKDGSYMHNEDEWDVMAFDIEDDENFKAICELLPKAVEKIENTILNGLKEGKITEEELWDRNYVEIPNTNPKKYRTKFTDFAKNYIQSVEDSILEENKQLLYATLLDDNSYLPAHNSIYDKPLTGDYKVDLKNSRSMRIYNDYVAMKIAKNTEPILLLPYPSDIGTLMYDLSSPVYVNNKHWGVFRVGFKI